MKTKIYGASDDLIEVEGEIEGEIDCFNSTNRSIKCSDGTEAKIKYDGNWNITVINTGSSFNKIILGDPEEKPHTDADCKNCSPYSDVLVLDGGIEWIKIGRKTLKK